jgi:hypothetical protein
MQQGSLIDLQPDFDGATYDRAQDHARLTNQLALVRDYMLRHGEWRTLREIHAATGAPEASISARLRDLRHLKHGAFTMESRRRSKGLWEYRVTR